ncbi:MAG: LysM domain [Verrucomicrobiota bacterium]|jgi:LysM repeat protein
MENDSISSSSSESKLPLIVGIVGFALGAAGLVLALKAKGSAEAATTAATKATDAAGEVSAALAQKANATDLTAITAELGNLRQGIDANNKTISDNILALQAAVKAKATAPAGGSGAKTAVAGPGSYAVQKGDTLSGIAKKAGISLKALQDLNPDVNPNRMQIGQLLKTK